MSIPSVQQLQQIVSACWEAACHAPMEGIPDGMVREVRDGQEVYHSPRWTAYGYLLNNLIPNHSVASGQFAAEMRELKENWQEDEE